MNIESAFFIRKKINFNFKANVKFKSYYDEYLK